VIWLIYRKYFAKLFKIVKTLEKQGFSFINDKINSFYIEELLPNMWK